MTNVAVADWSDEELCREIAAQQAGTTTRLEPEYFHLAQAEYDRRAGNKVDETALFNSLMSRL